MPLRARRSLLFCAVALLLPAARGEEKKEEKPAPPEVKLAVPFVVATGETNVIIIRGLSLTNTSGIHFETTSTNFVVEIKSKGKAEVPKPLEAKEAGDTQVEVSLFVPKETPAGRIQFVLESPQGAAKGNLLLVSRDKLVREVEPNGGFKNAQKISPGQFVACSIKEPMDVDVFQIELTKPGKLEAEVLAQEYGSFLDSSLVLYDAQGHLLAHADDQSKENRDARITLAGMVPGIYFVVVSDSHDSGGSAHPYVLRIATE
jgi:hypothetical protein